MVILTIEIPEWAKGRNIYIMAGAESIAVYCPDGKLWKKTKRCNYCGKCCIVDKNWDLGVKSGSEVGWEDNILVCKFLKREVWHFEPFNGQTVYVCTASSIAPYGCSTGPSPTCGRENWKQSLPECMMEFE